MLLSIRDLSAILKVHEATVYRWTRENGLPTRMVSGHYRTHPVDFLEWLADHPVPVDPRALPTDGAEEGLPSLEAAIRAGGVYRGLPGTTREEITTALVSRLPAIPGLPSEDLRRLLLRTESVGTAYLNKGIAVPNPRHPLILAPISPMLIVAFPANLIAWNGSGASVRVLFTLLTPSVRHHLRLLGRLIFALHDRAFDTLLLQRGEENELLATARALDHVTTVDRSAPTPEVPHR